MHDKTVQQYFLIALLAAVGIAVFYIVQPFLAPLALAAVFAVVLQPIYRHLLRRTRGSQGLASLATVFIFMVLILIPCIFFGARLLAESQQLYVSVASGEWRAELDTMLARSGPMLERYVPDATATLQEISASLDGYARTALAWLIQHLGVAFSGVSAFILALFIFFITLYYLLREGGRLCRYIVRLSPLADKDDEMILDKLATAVNSVVRGKLLIALIQGIFAGIGLFVFGVPNALLWALVATVAALVPPLGTGLVMVPAALYVFLAGHPGAAIGLVVWGIVAGMIDNVFGPALMARGAQQHPLLMMLAVLGGIAFFGPVGVFLGPLTVSLFLVLLTLHIEMPHTQDV
jgi:predicted PurR-regulated permease PerM